MIPINLKLNLSIEEASEYSNIGTDTLRKIMKEPDCPFVLYVGNKKLIKRKEFEEWNSDTDYILR